MAKLINISLPQNFVIRRYSGFFVRTQAVSMMATIRVRPSVIGTNNQWYTVVIPNCHRAGSTSSMSPPIGLIQSVGRLKVRQGPS